MLTALTEEDWTIVLRVFAASRSRRGDEGRNDRKFLEARHYFAVPTPCQPQSRAWAAMLSASSGKSD
jgi:hypothetical protein